MRTAWIVAAAVLAATATVAGPADADVVAWTAVPAEVGADPDNSLSAVTATADGAVWAVGTRDDGNATGFDYRALAERYDGATFKPVATPDPAGDKFDLLTAVSGTSDTDLWSVGYGRTADSGPDLPFTEHWDGAAWTLVPVPSVASAVLEGVAAIATDDVWAVGGDADGIGGAMTLHWDGSAWTRVRVPQPHVCNDYSWLTSVSALSTDNVWASGECATRSAGEQGFIVHWNGTRWSKSAGAGTVPAGSSLTSVSAASTHSVWAVGSVRVSQYSAPLVMRFDGSTWRQVAVTRAGRGDLYLGVQAGLGGLAWTVGVLSTAAGVETARFDSSGDQRLYVPSRDHCCWLQGITRDASGALWTVGFQRAPDHNHYAPLIATRPSG